MDSRQAYYDRIPDAPLDLYCYLNVHLAEEKRFHLCSTIEEKYSSNLTLNVVLEISKNKLVDANLQAVYFDSLGNTDTEFMSVKLLDPIFDSLRIEEIPTLSAIRDETFVVRVQLERFCPGYFFVNQRAIGRIIDESAIVGELQPERGKSLSNRVCGGKNRIIKPTI